MLRYLEIERWLWVLEFQEDSGTGWPHWHILIDRAGLPSNRVDLERAWSLWRDKWKVGGLDLRLRRQFEDASHAINYITAYMTKVPKMGFPIWVKQMAGVRFFQACQKLGPILGKPKSSDDAASDVGDDDEGDELQIVKPLQKCAARNRNAPAA